MKDKQKELVQEQYDRWKNQGRRKEQLESSYRVIGYGAVTCLVVFTLYSIVEWLT
jgi:hypothetical protein